MSYTETLGKINSLLSDLSYDELTLIAKYCMTLAAASAKYELMVGDKVTFDAKTRGLQTGVLIKKNAKSFQVLVGNVTWKVGPTLLKKVA